MPIDSRSAQYRMGQHVRNVIVRLKSMDTERLLPRERFVYDSLAPAVAER